MNRLATYPLFLTAIHLGLTLDAWAAVEDIVETFDGNGEFSSIDGTIAGLDNPGWDIDEDGTLEDGGYSFENENADDTLERTIEGTGSFR